MVLKRVLAVLLFFFLVLADVRSLFHYFALQDNVIKNSKTSIKYRTMIWLRVKTLSDFFEEYRKKQEVLTGVKEKFSRHVLLEKKEADLKIQGGRLCKIEGEIGTFFMHNKNIYVVIKEEKNFTLSRYIYDLSKCKRTSTTEFKYISSFSNGLLGIRKSNTVSLLHGFLKTSKEIDMGDILVKNVFKYGDKLYIHRERLIPGIPAVQIRAPGGIKEIFKDSRPSTESYEGDLLMEDTVFQIVSDRIYITFVYPLTEKLSIYEYSSKGEALKVLNLVFANRYKFPEHWIDNQKILARGVGTIYAVTGIFGDEQKLYISMERNAIEPLERDAKEPVKERLEHLMLVLDMKSRSFSAINIPCGLPVFYDGKNFHSVYLSSNEVYKWRLVRR